MSALITIRPAQANDVQQTTPLILSSGPAAFNWVFSDKQTQVLALLQQCFISGKTQFGYQNHYVAELKGKVVGSIAFYTRQDFARYNMQTLFAIVQHYGLIRCWPVLVKGLRMEAVLPPPAKDNLYLAHVAVDLQHQGLGIGSQLIHFALNSDRAKQQQFASLDVALNNPMAEKLYTRLGFKVIKQRPAATAGVPGHKLMQLTLD